MPVDIVDKLVYKCKIAIFNVDSDVSKKVLNIFNILPFIINIFYIKIYLILLPLLLYLISSIIRLYVDKEDLL